MFPEEMQELFIESTLDHTLQSSLFYCADETNPHPLLVNLHTWSYCNKDKDLGLLAFAKKNGWSFLMPNFRGPNGVKNEDPPKSCGSEYAKQDVFDAVDYVCAHYPIDRSRLLLLGASGGGHMALLIAAKKPKLFRAVASCVPVTDLAAWYREKEGSKYPNDLELICGGAPSEKTAEEYRRRSPISYVDALAETNTKIFSGLFDTVVPCHHGLDMYLAVHEKYPNARVFFEMFDGAHQINKPAVQVWFNQQLGESKNSAVSK